MEKENQQEKVDHLLRVELLLEREQDTVWALELQGTPHEFERKVYTTEDILLPGSSLEAILVEQFLLLSLQLLLRHRCIKARH